MDEIEEFKRTLGPAAKNYNEAQLRQLQNQMYAMAELLLDLHLAKKKRVSKRVDDPSLTPKDTARSMKERSIPNPKTPK